VPYDTPRLVVLIPENRDLSVFLQERGMALGAHGVGTLYENLLVLEATWRLLEQTPELRLPEMLRALVEEATHPEALERLAESLGERFKLHRRYLANQEKRVADLGLAPWMAACGTKESLFPAGDPDRRILLWLGEGDRLARFAKAFESPFGNKIQILTLPAAWIRGLPEDIAHKVVRHEKGAAAFTFGPVRLVYDRLGLRREGGDPESD
jgi:CRISPR-associated endonuclease/helicase Cas3